MTARRLAAIALAFVGVAAAATAAMASAGSPDDGDLAAVRAATARYRDVDRAIADGYVQFFGCVHEPLQGAMGIHFVNAALVGDPTLDPLKPEVLTYDVDAGGRYRLAGTEHVVFKDAWDATSTEPPMMFGRTLSVVDAPNRYGLPPFYEIHTWAWAKNPHGAHEDWNPRLLCSSTEGHVR